MNVSRLIKQLEIDEGIRLRVYEDSLGYLTVGIGHYINKNDPEDIKDLKIGDRITKERAYSLLMNDLAVAIQDAVIIFYSKWETFPHAAQEVFINMIFNMGRTRFMKFRKTIAAAYAHDWNEVSKEMLDSRWATQVGNRAGRLSSKIRALAK
ncbi:MAG: hypothetical protein DRJ64_09415 [Thermoprotei archaeon]|nr:MAG: hypothetical protein DRJ64_09415 [Thermoprotei archaeon]